VIDDTLVVYGEVSVKSLQATKVKMFGRAKIDGDLITRESAILGSIYVSGDSIHSGKTISLSEYRVEGKMGIKGISEFNDNLFVGSSLMVAGTIDPKLGLYASKVTVNEKDSRKLVRVKSDSMHVVMFENTILINTLDFGWKSINGKEELMKFIKDESKSLSEREAATVVLEHYDCLSSMMSEIQSIS
jgi:hypothetical protein